MLLNILPAMCHLEIIPVASMDPLLPDSSRHPAPRPGRCITFSAAVRVSLGGLKPGPQLEDAIPFREYPGMKYGKHWQARKSPYEIEVLTVEL
jgi:hypothetical protein